MFFESLTLRHFLLKDYLTKSMWTSDPYPRRWLVNISFHNYEHFHTAFILLLSGFSTRCGNLAAAICSHSATRVSVRSNTDADRRSSSSQRCWVVLRSVLCAVLLHQNGKTISLWTLLCEWEHWYVETEKGLPQTVAQSWKYTIVWNILLCYSIKISIRYQVSILASSNSNFSLVRAQLSFSYNEFLSLQSTCYFTYQKVHNPAKS